MNKFLSLSTLENTSRVNFAKRLTGMGTGTHFCADLKINLSY